MASLTLAQTAYQTDAPLITLPTITAVMPLASLAVGIVALHETAHLNGARIVIMMACLAVAITALAGLARASAAAGEASEQPDDNHRPAKPTKHPAGPAGPHHPADGPSEVQLPGHVPGEVRQRLVTTG